jgi:hypothetical protein
MKTSNIKPYLLLLLMPAFFCCKKVIDVSLTNASPQIVIQGSVTNAPGPYHISLTKTVKFSDSNTYPPVSGATVKITDVTAGTEDVLTETDAGVYATRNLPQGMPGHTYRLDVTTGTSMYTATSVMPQPVTLDSVTFQHNTNFGKLQINAVPNFQDPAGISNYYTFHQYINGKSLNKEFVMDDRLSDGKYIARQLFTDSAYLQAGDVLTLQMNCTDKAVYTYFNTLQQAADANGFQSSTPSNPVSNISNNALGYFSANTVNYKTTVVK